MAGAPPVDIGRQVAVLTGTGRRRWVAGLLPTGRLATGLLPGRGLTAPGATLAPRATLAPGTALAPFGCCPTGRLGGGVHAHDQRHCQTRVQVPGDRRELGGSAVVPEHVVLLQTDLGEVGDRLLVPGGGVHLLADVL